MKIISSIIAHLLVGLVSSSLAQNVNHKVPLEDKAILNIQELKNNRPLARKDDEPGPDYRLPTSLIPLHYFLQIRPIFDRDHPGVGRKNTAPGFVRLTASCVTSTNRVVMHEKFLTINETSIEVRAVKDSSLVGVTTVEYDSPRNFLIINLANELRPNEDYQISMEFMANVPPNDTLRGLYSEEYFDELTNQTKVMAVTQLEPLRARQVLPCLDEPTYKAKFDVVIGRTENFSALCNGPLLKTEPDEKNQGWFWDTFNTTVKMPTYLLAIGISEYSYNEADPSLYRLPVRVYGPKHLISKNRGQLTADGSAKLMKYFEEKYGIPHNMPKIDSISVPLKRGAMENYGLITYGENYLMYYPNTTLFTELRNIYNILAHELGHQWFGNKITCKWWSDIWLNEGFATYVSYEAMDRIGLNFEALNYMVHDTVNIALQYDATPSSHPIHQEAHDAAQIGKNMDTIGYDKGASLIRMMISFLGEETFYDGVKHYLTRLYDDVAEQDDLFQDLNDAANRANLSLPKSVKEIMDTWTLQKGFPLIRATLNSSDSISITQETWQNEDTRNDSTTTTSWDIPVKYLVQTGQDSGQVGSLWLLQDENHFQNISIPNNSQAWVLTNPDAGGYYRTLYDVELSKRIREQLESNHSVFEPSARVRLLDDQFQLANQRYIPIQSALEFTRYLHKETDYTVWSSVLGNLLKIRSLYRNTAVIDSEDLTALQNYLVPKIQSAISNLTRDSREIQLSQLLDWSCSLNSEFCAFHAANLLRIWTNDPDTNPISNEIQSTMYCKIVELGVEGFDWIYAQYEKLSTADDDKHQRSRLSSALGCTHNSSLVNTVISMILDTNSTRRISKLNSIPVFQRLLTHSKMGPSVLSLVFIHSPDVIPNYYEGDLNSLLQILNSVSTHFATPVHYIMMESIAEANPTFYKDSLNSTIAAIAGNIGWLTEYRDDVTDWLKANA